MVRRWYDDEQVCAVYSFADAPQIVAPPLAEGEWEVLLDSAASRWDGPGGQADERITSSGMIELPVQGNSCVLLMKRED